LLRGDKIRILPDVSSWALHHVLHHVLLIDLLGDQVLDAENKFRFVSVMESKNFIRSTNKLPYKNNFISLYKTSVSGV
jgi:hypothetical protein